MSFLAAASALLAVALAACAPSAPDARDSAPTTASPSAYVIRGEPLPNGWPRFRALIAQGRLLLDSPTSAGWYASALSQRPGEAGRRTFAGERLTLSVEPGACRLSEYYPSLPDRIELEWDGGRFEGCGGARPAAARVEDTVWELVRIGGEAAPAGRSPAATLVLGAAGSVGGTLGCNDGGLRRRWAANGTFDGVAQGFEQTAIGCNDAAEAFGRRFWNAMATARAWRRDGDRLFVTFADGTQAELRYLL